MRKVYSIIIISIIFIIVNVFTIYIETKKSRQEIERIRHELEESRRWREQVQEWLDKLKIEPDMTVSYYAPLDPAAQKGMCHNGDQFHTATGTYPCPGTFAVNPDVIPYGSRVAIIYQDGTIEHGRALDTGGAIRASRSKIDVFRQTREEAIRDGLKKATVVHYR